MFRLNWIWVRLMGCTHLQYSRIQTIESIKINKQKKWKKAYFNIQKTKEYWNYSWSFGIFHSHEEIFDFLSTTDWLILTTWFFVWFRIIWNNWNQEQRFESFNFLKIHFRYLNTRERFRMKTDFIFDTKKLEQVIRSFKFLKVLSPEGSLRKQTTRGPLEVLSILICDWRTKIEVSILRW